MSCSQPKWKVLPLRKVQRPVWWRCCVGDLEKPLVLAQTHQHEGATSGFLGRRRKWRWSRQLKQNFRSFVNEGNECHVHILLFQCLFSFMTLTINKGLVSTVEPVQNVILEVYDDITQTNKQAASNSESFLFQSSTVEAVEKAQGWKISSWFCSELCPWEGLIFILTVHKDKGKGIVEWIIVHTVPVVGVQEAKRNIFGVLLNMTKYVHL